MWIKKFATPFCLRLELKPEVMEKFKFRAPPPAPKTNRNSSGQNNRQDAAPDNLWMDDIDEQTLLQASQLVEDEVPLKVGKNWKPAAADF